MSLKHILLGMLQQPKSGYDVKKMFDQVFSNFWAAELSQIYPQLKKLTHADLLSVVEAESDKGPNKKIYQTTEKGKRELVNWLSNGPVTNTEKLAYMAQTFFLNALNSDREKLKFLEDLQGHMNNWLNVLLESQSVHKANYKNYPLDLPEEMFYPNLTLMLGVKKVTANVEWVNEAIHLIKQRMNLKGNN